MTPRRLAVKFALDAIKAQVRTGRAPIRPFRDFDKGNMGRRREELCYPRNT
jgi:hypothetical protein